MVIVNFLCMNIEDSKHVVVDLINRYRHQVDFLAIRLEVSQETDILLRKNKIETICEGISVGGQVRACYKGGWGFATFNSLATLKMQLEEAILAARLVGNEVTVLAEIAAVQGIWELPMEGTSPVRISLEKKKELCDRYNELLLQQGGLITTTSVRYNDSSQTILLATSEGTVIQQAWVDMEMRFAATARKGDLVQIARETTGSRSGWEDLTDLDYKVTATAQRAINALSLPVVKGNTYQVVIDPILTGLFVHEAFGHLSEADMLYENPELLEVMSKGKRFGPENLQIYDGAAPQGHRGSYFYDDEGTPATTTQLIQDGVLVGRLHSRETAGKLGEQPTGNARCLNYQYTPIVRMTNTWIGRGTTPVADLVAEVNEGIYACNWLGGMTNGEMFTFTAGEAWMIKDGKLAEPVRDVTLSGNVFKTLANIEAIGDDFAWDESGGCGKGGQSGLPVGCGGPSLRIKDVVIGGDISG